MSLSLEVRSERLAKFEVNPGKYNPYKPDSRYYYHVHVFSTRESMWAAGAKISPWEKDHAARYGAITIPCWKEKPLGNAWLRAPKIGDVLFHIQCLGSECISHEAVHMATSYLRALNLLKLGDQIDDDDEERLAYCIGGCTRQIVDELYKLHIL